ncbi:MAG: hypothetical protein JKY48_20530 [Flavobacteriales bacterium]|nr:hypothetical protein [Flavobacteriales bacterium]
MDEAMIFDRAISSAEVLTLFWSRHIPLVINTYNVSNAASILSVDAEEKDIIYTTIGGKYVVQSDSISGYLVDSCVVVPTINGNYAILQVRDKGFYVEDFGAIAGDNKDDSPAIQKCIDAVIKLDITSRVNAGPGIFTLKKGVVASNKLTDSSYSFTVITISGAIPCYSPAQSYGNTTVFSLNDSNSFGLAIQKARNCLIENIVFLGIADYPKFTSSSIPADINTVIENTEVDWENSGMRLNKNSPSCGIVIDPFAKGTASQNQYPGFSSYYINSSSDGGSSMLKIQACSFINHYIAIANNPSIGIQNGDNIRVQDSHVKRCHTFWACGQSQSRSNSIENIYGLYLHTFIDGRSIGVQQGTAPTVSNVNLAGFTKKLFNVNSQFTPIRVNNSYFESIWNLGYIGSNNTSFNQCQIKFLKPSNTTFAPGSRLSTPNQCSFRDCSIEYTDNCNTEAPFMFKTNGLLISGGFIEGGIVVSNGYTNSGGDLIHNVDYENVHLKCKNQVIGKNSYGMPLANTKGVILMAGEEISLNYVPVKFVNNSNYNYNIALLESNKNISINTIDKKAIIIGVNPGQYQIGDNLFADFGSTKRALGYVAEINNDTIVVSSVPYGYTDISNVKVYSASYPIFVQPIWGDITAGSDTIKNIVTNQYPNTATKIFHGAFPPGSYIKEKNSANNYIIMSTAATSSHSFSLLKNAPYVQEVYVSLSDWEFDSTLNTPFIEGTIIRLSNPGMTNAYYGYICTKGGIIGAAKMADQPIFHTLQR